MTSATSDAFDVVVIGSGSAALSAALRTLAGGLSVAVVEKSDLLGGTSAMSGAGTWIPANHIARENGVEDSEEDALSYIRAASPEGWEEKEGDLWSAFVHNAPKAFEFIDGNTRIEFDLLNEPDPMSELPGGKIFGRMLSPKPISRNILGPFKNKIRRSTLPHWITYKELVDDDPYHHPIRYAFRRFPQIFRRFLTNSGAQGTALMVGLIRACMDRGCTFLLGTQAVELRTDPIDGRVNGVVVEQGSIRRLISARAGVVVATGGFEWNEAMLKENFPGDVDRLGSPRTNQGDGHRMLAAVGAELDRMDQANIFPCLPTKYEGHPHGVPITFQTDPHSIIVDRKGRRFASETDFNIGEIMDRRDALTGEPVHLPVWLIGDRRFIRNSLPFRWYSGKQPGWVIKAKSIAELAARTDLPPRELQNTIERFNSFSDANRDLDFHRGESVFGDYKSHGANNRIGSIEDPPFFAVSFNRCILGTKGGARTTPGGQVVRKDGSIIAGLFAAGLTMANPIGTRAIGAGTTIGPNLTWGFICAETIIHQNRREI